MKEKITVILLALLLVGGAALFYTLNKTEYFPTFCISMITLGFSYYAYLFSKEKFRLDLVDKRWEIYEEVLKFCSTVTKYGGLPKHSSDKENNEEIINALKSAHNSFRGIGLHKARSLFDNDIIEILNNLNEDYAFFITYNENRHDWAKEDHRRLLNMYETIKRLPDIFKPYVYFGDYKK